ncbi:MAG: prepilin-type N-terminal cleavage/methylation domain-containing protein [Pirellulales bacterium]|nr:prepilin-type N-terminal cleavage/methylation domain-containing protein [Pirellulales bacterium]
MFHHCRLNKRRAMTLLELMIAMTVIVLVMGTLGGVARTVQQGYEYSEGYGSATQHARIALERIAENVRQATANDLFPGCLVVAEYENSCRFPDTLVVWRPGGTPVDAAGLPRFNELIVYCPDPDAPNQFVELTAPTNAATVPAADDQAGWRAAIEALKQNADAEKIVLTDQLRTCSTSEGELRGAARFETRLRPAASDWAEYKAGSTDWSDLPWVQGIYGTGAGLRQVWVRIELQLVPGRRWTASGADAADAVPFLGSATLYYQLTRE